jgi:hypothetical protein
LVVICSGANFYPTTQPTAVPEEPKKPSIKF